MSSQTTGANEYFSKRISLKSALFFFVAMFLLYFILFLSVKSAFPLHSLQKKLGPSEKLQQICLHTGRMTNRCRFSKGFCRDPAGCFTTRGGDSENITRHRHRPQIAGA
ncbi:hypothetical protein [Arthrobacter sulfonylureivorans]|uniref:Uncharacterized protein n=1 Tax=Arthrobacter sulfonylureivorans TaxID=2486855 RepID=A0ABY3W3S6_9MICC|nr:hypothetical protein [Arthrobacter sulfonylureivorans]UNK44743.1 hypothetical protein MNQ99_12275 [Arthrobacter sulfonylureivorans]